jgi:lipoate-protein ligase A
MIFIQNTNTNPYFNIAAEEYLLREYNEDIFMLYIDEPSIIVGKHQNTMAEINYRFVIENNIAVIRRISGGGTVFHDLGNLNFCFIANGKEGYLVDFRRFTQPIMEVIQNLGIDVKFEGKNDLRINGFKISGNAEHVYKNRVLHHGTLLINSDLNKLSEGLKIIPEKYTDNAVKSIRSKVANLNDFLSKPITIDAFAQHLIERLNCPLVKLKSNDIELIEKLATNKYKTWEWNFGYSPKYQFCNEFYINEEKVQIKLDIENGVIYKCSNSMNEDLAEKLIGAKHEYNSIINILKALSVDEIDFIWNLF